MEERPDEILIECMEESEQYRGVVLETSTETKESHGFQTNCLCDCRF